MGLLQIIKVVQCIRIYFLYTWVINFKDNLDVFAYMDLGMNDNIKISHDLLVVTQ